MLTLLSLKEFPTTETELKLMAAAAITGLSRIPKTGYKTPAAIGTPKELYTKAKNRFCLMFFMVAINTAIIFNVCLVGAAFVHPSQDQDGDLCDVAW